MRTFSVLLCDDNPMERASFRDAVQDAWFDLFPDKIRVDTCEDIVEKSSSATTEEMSSLADYDALLMDICWGDIDNAHGIDLIEQVRSKYPGLPILIYSGQIKLEHFQRIMPLGVSAYLSKNELNTESWCAETRDAIFRGFGDTSGAPLYEKLSKVCRTDDAWSGSAIESAMFEVWRHGHSYDKWDVFWDELNSVVGKMKLTLPFKKLKESFARDDLFVLGVAPGMRGHLDHVLSVYFTGYVIINSIPDFKKKVFKAVQHLLGGDYKNKNKEIYWDLFQFAWLACATLHDTGYAIQVLPDAVGKCRDIEELHAFADTATPTAEWADVSLEWDHTSGRAKKAFQHCLSTLHSADSQWIEEHATFTDKKGKIRFNHGVASGILFAEQVEKWGKLPDQPEDIPHFMDWAATAMALHSQKHPGSDSDIDLSPDGDPLSFLLLLCDELQTWHRERPDKAAASSMFRSSRLEQLDVSKTEITAEVVYFPFPRDVNVNDHANKLIESVNENNALLAKYLCPGKQKITVNYTIMGTEKTIAPLVLGG